MSTSPWYRLVAGAVVIGAVLLLALVGHEITGATALGVIVAVGGTLLGVEITTAAVATGAAASKGG